jgi:hypothetical protein
MGTTVKVAYSKILYSLLCIIIPVIKYINPLNACADDKDREVRAGNMIVC